MPRLRPIIRRDFISKLGRRIIRILWKAMMLYAALWDPQWSQEAQSAEAPTSQPPFHRDLRDWAYHRASSGSTRPSSYSSSSSSSSGSIKIDVPTTALDCAFALLDAELRELPDSDGHDDS